MCCVLVCCVGTRCSDLCVDTVYVSVCTVRCGAVEWCVLRFSGGEGSEGGEGWGGRGHVRK